MTKQEMINELKSDLDLAELGLRPYVNKRKIEAYKMAIKALEQEQKTGHWIVNTDLGYYVSICSNCDWRGHGNELLIYRPKYCPNCGARMIEKNLIYTDNVR